jgi:outer membrane protein assembly factor BamA
MSRRLLPRTILLGSIYAVVCSQPIHGQSPPNSARCSPPSVTSKDKTELTGEKILPKVVIDSVVFDGPTSLSSSVRDRLVAELKEHAAHSAGTRWLEEWNEVVVKDAWRDEGFFKMTSIAKAQIISSDATEQHVAVTVHVGEGMQYRLRDIRFGKEPQIVPADADGMQPDSDEAADSTQPSSDEGPDNSRHTVILPPVKIEFPEFHDTEHLNADLVFPPQELRKRFSLSDGDVLDTSKIKEGLDALSRLYQSRGYVDFAATPETITDDKSAMISLIMVLDEGKQFRVGRVEAYNLDPEKEAKLKSLIQPGDIYNSEPFGDFLRKNRLPFISVLQQNEDTGTIDLQFGYPTTCP